MTWKECSNPLRKPIHYFETKKLTDTCGMCEYQINMTKTRHDYEGPMQTAYKKNGGKNATFIGHDTL